MKKSLKYLMNKPKFVKFLGILASLYLRFVYLTSSWKYEGIEYPEQLIKEGNPFILCFWHGRLMMLPFSWKWKKKHLCHMLISSHRDGRLIAETIRALGMESFSGSSSKKGSKAFRAMIHLLKKGKYIGITPDGPKGPAFESKEGLIKASYLAQAPIVPITFSTSRKKFMKTWDTFLLAKPFSRGIFLWDKPIFPPQKGNDIDFTKFKDTVTQSLQDICEKADRKVDNKHV